MNFRFRLPYFFIFVVLAVGFFGSFGRNTTAADHEWPKAQRAPLRVAFTFDDGPNDGATRAIVDILDRQHVPATFFEVGHSIAAEPSTTKYVVDHGFLIGDHTWDHSFAIPTMSSEQVQQELVHTNELIAAVTGHAATLTRWPHGAHSAIDDRVIRELHLRSVTWNVDPQDYLTQDPQLLTSRVLHAVRDKSVILLHDNLQDGQFAVKFHDRRGTIAALPMIIEQLRARGAEFLTVPAMLQLKYGPSKKP